MKITEYISELLYEHDCVIVPGFGGFVCNYAPARIDPVKHLFEPPGKRILFNKGLTRNDGLLAHYVSGKLKLSYPEALNTIAEEVKDYLEELQKDKHLALDNIGVLYLDEKGTLLFQQDNRLNYMPESYGLSAFYHLPVVQKKAPEGKLSVPASEEKYPAILPVRIHNERKKVRTYAAAAVITALVAGAFYFTLLEKSGSTTGGFSSLNLFSKREAPQYLFSPSAYKELPRTEVQPILDNAVVTLPAKVTESTPPEHQGAYYSVILGSFIAKENADNLINEFEKQHLHASILGKSPQGLYWVGYGRYSSHDLASADRDMLRRNLAKDAWIKAM